MEIRVGEQALELALALAIGIALGLIYDLLRPPRRHGGKLLAAATDCIFALVSAFGLFLFAMRAESGSLGTWELVAALLGFLVYMHALSCRVLPVLEKIFQLIGKSAAQVSRNVKKVQDLLKKLFPKIRECFKIKN